MTAPYASPDPPPALRKVLAALIRLGATKEDLEAYVAEYEHRHRFIDPNLPARTNQGEEIRAGTPPRKESPAELIAGLLGSAAQGATLGFSDELGGAVRAAGALVPGGDSPAEAYRKQRDATRQQLHGFQQEHPVLSTAAEMAGGVALPVGAVRGPLSAGKLSRAGAAVGGAYGLGKGEGSVAEQTLSTAGGAAVGAGAGLLGAGVARAAPSLARLFGVTTAKGRAAAADRAIQEALEATGQTSHDVLARVAAAGNNPITFAEALGPAADDVLARMGPLGPQLRGLVFQEAQRFKQGPTAQLGIALERVAKKQPAPKMNVGELAGVLAAPVVGGAIGGPVGSAVGGAASLAFSPLARRAATAGVRKAAKAEQELLMKNLLGRVPAQFQPPPPPSGAVVGRIVPRPPAPSPAPIPTGPPPAPSPAGGIGPIVHSPPGVTSSGAKQRGATGAQLAYRAERFGKKPAFSEEVLEAMARELAEPQNVDDNLETLLRLSLQRRRPR